VHLIPLAELWGGGYSKDVRNRAHRSQCVPTPFTNLVKPHCHRYVMPPRPKQHVKCQVECSKGANHIIRNKGRMCNFEPCDLDTARLKIANAFLGESALPQPWVHPTFGRAYHSGETVLLVPPVCIPTSDTDTVNVCSAAWSREGIATSWLKQQTPGVRRVRKQAEATTLLPLPQPQVRLFLVSTCVCACVLCMFRVSISLLLQAPCEEL
jgi:hypothetical protein